MRFKSLLTFFFLFFISLVYAQKEYARHLGNDGDDNAEVIIVNQDGSYLLVGITNSFSTAKSLLLNKVDTSGTVLWTKRISSPRSLSIKVGKKAKDGGYLLAGSTNAAGAGKKDALVIKLDTAGLVEWSNLYGGELNEYIFDLQETKKGNILITGETNSFNSDLSDVFFTQLNKDGDILWSKAIGDTGVDFGFSVIETLDGFLLANETDSYGNGDIDISLLKLDTVGTVIFNKCYRGEKDELGYAMVETDSAKIYIAGTTTSFGMGGIDSYLLELESDGSLISARTYGDRLDDQVYRMKLLPQGGLYLTGFTNSYQEQLNSDDGWLIRLTPNLHFKWARVFGGENADYFLDSDIDTTGNIYMCGETLNYSGRTDNDVYVVKASDTGNPVYCEQARVHTITLRITEELIVEDKPVKVREITPIVTKVIFEEEEVAIQHHVICNDDDHHINGNRKK